MEPRRVDVRHVERRDGRQLGAAVAFQRRDAEAVVEGLGEVLAQLLGAHDHAAQLRETRGLDAAQVGG